MSFSDSALVSRIDRTVCHQRLFGPGDTLVVAFSGGADSSALLDILSRLPGYNLNLIAAHLNHCLRGVESDADEDFCREVASRYKIPFEAQRIDIKGMATDLRLNLEDAGRRARIEFLDEINRKYQGAAVVLAHHADDQAETVLMRLLRGSGMTGLSGMTYRNARGYVRPLLEISRSEIEQYLQRCGLKWRDDASNNDTVYLRNRIRHQLLPLLEEYNPAIRSCLATTASILGGDEVLIRDMTEQVYSELFRMEKGSCVCSIAQLGLLNPALQRRVLRRAFKQLAESLEGVSQLHVGAIGDMIASARPNSRLVLPCSVTAVREYDRFALTYTDTDTVKNDGELQITEPGCYQLPQGGCLTVVLSDTTVFPPHPDCACFDLDKTPLPWLVRTFRPGDRIIPFGMSGRKKVKDIYIDRKIPPSDRSRMPLLFCGENLIWIAGVCTSELSRISTPAVVPVHVTWHACAD
ncbi:MAG: tRNA lysidine(34) synthetase TilS [Desulfuromonadaceae bacterium]|nr:tRNA lysidine(34) synthetase TilS [Desulfuromonadaceae bacterium]